MTSFKGFTDVVRGTNLADPTNEDTSLSDEYGSKTICS
jgi:hypothetical protein